MFKRNKCYVYKKKMKTIYVALMSVQNKTDLRPTFVFDKNYFEAFVEKLQ